MRVESRHSAAPLKAPSIAFPPCWHPRVPHKSGIALASPPAGVPAPGEGQGGAGWEQRLAGAPAGAARRGPKGERLGNSRGKKYPKKVWGHTKVYVEKTGVAIADQFKGKKQSLSCASLLFPAVKSHFWGKTSS